MLCPFSIHNIQYSQFASLETLIAALGKVGSEALEQLNEQDEDDDRNEHDEVLVTIVAVVDGDLAQAAAADDAAHRRVAQDGGQRDGDILNKRGDALGDHDLPDYLRGSRTHTLSGLNDIAVKLAQTALDKAGNERERCRNERDDGRRCADCRTDDRAGKRQHHDHEDKKGDRAQKVNDRIQHMHEPRRKRQNAVLFAGHEQHAERQADEQRKRCAEHGDIECLPQSCGHTRQSGDEILYGLFGKQIIVHRRQPPEP